MFIDTHPNVFSQHVHIPVFTFIIYVEIAIGRLGCGSYGDGSSYNSCNNIGGGKHIRESSCWTTTISDG